MPFKTLDFLVTAIDNFGDIGFALDLAESVLFERPNWKIRFFCDNQEIFLRLCDGRPHSSVEYRNLSEYEKTAPSRFVFSFFDRKIPSTHLEKYAYPKKIFQISYLRLDSKVASMNGTRYFIGKDEVIHLVPSPLPNGAWIVVNENTNCAITRNVLGGRSVFCYPETLAKIRKLEMLSTMMTNVFGENCGYVRFDEYPRVLRDSVSNIVRGENSAAKAMLAGKPFLWDFYKEKNGAHTEKIEDFLAFIEPFFDDSETFETYARATRSFNAENCPEESVDLWRRVFIAPTEKMYGVFARLSEQVRKTDITMTVLMEIEA